MIRKKEMLIKEISKKFPGKTLGEIIKEDSTMTDVVVRESFSPFKKLFICTNEQCNHCQSRLKQVRYVERSNKYGSSDLEFSTGCECDKCACGKNKKYDEHVLSPKDMQEVIIELVSMINKKE